MKKQLFLILTVLTIPIISPCSLYAKDYSFDRIMGDIVNSISLSKPSITNIRLTDNDGNDSNMPLDGLKEFPSDTKTIYIYFKYNDVPATDDITAIWSIWFNNSWNELGKKFLIPPLASDDGAFAIPVNDSGYWTVGKYKIEILANNEPIGTTFFNIFKSKFQNKYNAKNNKNLVTTKKYTDTRLGVEISYPSNWMLSGTMGSLELLDEKGREKVTIRETFRSSR
ncbi:MAG TPA: hypothetical protein QF753_16455 [Victivallales bacterium]|nr:hypothetical protein [Victivallales bacterium]